MWQLLWMVTYHPQDGDTLSLGWSPTIKNVVTNLPEDGHHPQNGHPPSPGGSSTIQNFVTHQHEGSCTPSSGGSLSQLYGRTPSIWWSPTNSIKLTTIHRIIINFPSTVTHYVKDGQLDLEFDSSAAKLVNLVVILAQLVSSSVAQLVIFSSGHQMLIWGS